MIDGTYSGGPIFDGDTLHHGWAVRIDGGVVSAIGPRNTVPHQSPVDLNGDILCPGYVDLQVNGGGGVMLNDAPTVATLKHMAAAHRNLGALHILPTLITAPAEVTIAAIEAATEACAVGTPGLLGLHLEGPHIARAGAHDPALIRRMEDGDLDLLLIAAKSLPLLKITLAPENVTPEQVACLAAAGAVVSLGHTDADYETCLQYFNAGACLATHLFNAMSQLGSRSPGLVGATLSTGSVSAGLIADGHHVHPATIRVALEAKAGPGEIFLVSDAMATAGSEIGTFTLHGQQVTRDGGRLTLPDGTLAGADLTLTRAVSVLVGQVGVPLESALRRVTSIPGQVAGGQHGRLSTGTAADLIRIAPDLSGCVPVS